MLVRFIKLELRNMMLLLQSMNISVCGGRYIMHYIRIIHVLNCVVNEEQWLIHSFFAVSAFVKITVYILSSLTINKLLQRATPRISPLTKPKISILKCLENNIARYKTCIMQSNNTFSHQLSWPDFATNGNPYFSSFSVYKQCI